MIAILNTKKKRKGKAIYNIFINKEFICSFEHCRKDGLAECLLKASEAVDDNETEAMIRVLGLRQDGI